MHKDVGLQNRFISQGIWIWAQEEILIRLFRKDVFTKEIPWGNGFGQL